MNNTTLTSVTGTDPTPENELLLSAHRTSVRGPWTSTRAYRHPALQDDRVVVRLTGADLSEADDRIAVFQGLLPDGEPATVGITRRRAVGFLEWVLIHHPQDGHRALALMPELDRACRRIRSKPQAAFDAVVAPADRLAASLPHFLPVFPEHSASSWSTRPGPSTPTATVPTRHACSPAHARTRSPTT